MKRFPKTGDRIHSAARLAPRRAPLQPRSSYRVLIVDDEVDLLTATARSLRPLRFDDVATAETDSKCLEILRKQQFDVILLDYELNDGKFGFDLIEPINEIDRDVMIVILTSSIEEWVHEKARRDPRLEIWPKPLPKDLECKKNLLLGWGDRATHRRESRAKDVEIESLRAETRDQQRQLGVRWQDEKFDRIKGKSSALLDMLEKVAKVADTDGTVLITGESGTGKELVAQTIHYKSARAKRPLVTVNCGAIPEELLESELFGHVKGAFTSAVSSRKGRFEAAEGGTIFLDEIGDMSPTLQVKLLRVLQEKTFEPVGSSQTQVADVRVIAATHQNLEQLIQEKRFREDLFYRLNVLPISVPPLRERKPLGGSGSGQAGNDILNLADHFLHVWNAQRPGRNMEFSIEALEKLEAYEWPGNIRQLENCIERMVVMGPHEGGELGVDLLPPEIANAEAPAPAIAPRVGEEGIQFNEVVDQVETDLILQALELTNWNKNQAAARLGLNRTTLLEKIKKKGLRQPED